MRSFLAFGPDLPHCSALDYNQSTSVQTSNLQEFFNKNQFEGSFPFIKVQKVPPSFSCPAPWPIYWSERRGREGRNGHLSREAQVQKMGGDQGDKCALTRPIWGGRVGRLLVNRESKSGFGQWSMGRKNRGQGGNVAVDISAAKKTSDNVYLSDTSFMMIYMIYLPTKISRTKEMIW